MPDIMRRADRQQESVPEEWGRFLECYNTIQTCKENGIDTDYAIRETWGEMTDLDFEFLMAGISTIDRVRAKLYREKLDRPQQSGSHPHSATKIEDPFAEFK